MSIAPALDRAPIFRAVRILLGRGLRDEEVGPLDRAIDDALGIAPAPAEPTSTRLGNPLGFFASLRRGKVIGPEITQGEVDGCNVIVEACGAAGWPMADAAYALATAYHETAGTMQPIGEYGGPTYFRRMYDIEGTRPAKARELGNVRPGDGARYCGRGYVQLTGRANYGKATVKLRALGILKVGESLIDEPDLAMRPDVAAATMIHGMAEGWFTGRDIDDDLPRAGPATLEQFVLCRDIINGSDKADKIGREAIAFQHALSAGDWP